MEDYPVKSTPGLDGELGLVQTNRTGEVRELGLVDDAVFGQLDEDSPNYRNVCLSELLLWSLLSQLPTGEPIRYDRSDDENANWSGCVVHSVGL